mgnify:FL=1|jgi:hypothetical protein
MAETKKKDERVEVFIPRGERNSDPMLFVSVNGKNYLLPKGKTSLVPTHVADEINRSVLAQRMLDESIDELRYKGE